MLLFLSYLVHRSKERGRQSYECALWLGVVFEVSDVFQLTIPGEVGGLVRGAG